MKGFFATHGNKQRTEIKQDMQQDRNSILMGFETNSLVPDCVTNTQSDTIILET